VAAELARGSWGHSLRAERTLATTNDFLMPFAGSATFSALFGSQDDYDYVDRWRALAGVTRLFGTSRDRVLRLEVGPARDRAVRANVSRGLFESDSGFRPVRGVEEGNYLSTTATAQYHPHVSGLFLEPGVGAELRYERADGGVRWQRVEARLVSRRRAGPLSVIGRVHAGALLGGAIAPQALFELGEGEGLPGYGYKEFGGDRALLGRVMAIYNFPILRAPIRLTPRFFIPGLTPGVSAGVHAGWAEASSAQARAALLALGTRPEASANDAPVPVSVPTERVRATVDLRVTFFGGAASLGVARPVDHRAPWKFVGTFGQAF
jgi:hypothetical protein